MKGPPLGPGGEDITWLHQVAPYGRNASSTQTLKPEISNRKPLSTSITFRPPRCAVVILGPYVLAWPFPPVPCRPFPPDRKFGL